MNSDQLIKHFERIAEAPDAISLLRKFVLDLAVRGKLVEQDPNDEPASALLEKIEAEKTKLIKAGQIKFNKPLLLVEGEQQRFEVPKHWKWVQIRTITTDRGQKVPDKLFSYIDVSSVDNVRGTVSSSQVLMPEEAPSRARKIVCTGDLIYSCVRPYLLNVALIEQFEPEVIVSTAFAVLNGFGLTSMRYLWMVLRSPFFFDVVQEKMRGQAYPAINDRDFALLPIPLPPLAEQHRIVAKVDELMALCDELEAAQAKRETQRDHLVAATLHHLNNSDSAPATFEETAHFYFNHLPRLTTRPEHIKQLRQTILTLAIQGKLVSQDPSESVLSLLQDLCIGRKKIMSDLGLRSQALIPNTNTSKFPFKAPDSWEWLSVDDCFVVTGGIQKTPHRTPRNNAFPYLGVANVYRGCIDLAEVKKFELNEGELNRYRLEPNDLLIVEGNGSANEVGRCAQWSGELPVCVHQNHIIRCRPGYPGISNFISLYLNSPIGIELMKQLAVTSAGLYNLSVGKIRNIRIPLPPLAEQHRIVARVDELLAVCDELEARLAAATDTRRALLEATLHEALAPIA
jgi:type I restriction enzyme S subunit